MKRILSGAAFNRMQRQQETMNQFSNRIVSGAAFIKVAYQVPVYNPRKYDKVARPWLTITSAD
jgi:hypothetical protein